MNETIGQELRQARLERKLSLEEVSRATFIRLQHLQAMEAGKFEALPSPAQARGFLRAYASYLGLASEAMLEQLGGSRASGQTAEQQYQAAFQVIPLNRLSEEPRPEPFIPPEASQAGQDNFAQIGQQLRQRREILGLTLDEVEKHTHVRDYFLQALETGDLDRLPSSVQARGMLVNYAGFLGLDTEPLLLMFADGLQARFTASHPRQNKLNMDESGQSAAEMAGGSASPPKNIRRVSFSEYIWGAALLLLLVGFVSWGLVKVLATRTAEAEMTIPTPPPIADVLLTTPTTNLVYPSPSVTMSVAPTTLPTITPLAPDLTTTVIVMGDAGTPTPQTGKIQVNIAVRQQAWMRITVDGQVAFQGRVNPGSAYPFSGNDRIEVLTGNGSALQVYYNQQDLGPLGFPAEVVDRIFTLEGIETPTATVTSTPTVAQPVTPTRKP